MEGIVVWKSQGTCAVDCNGQRLMCSISNRLRKNLVYPLASPTNPKRRGKRVVKVDDINDIDPISIGDRVEVIQAGDNAGQIAAVLPRRNELTRPKAARAGGHAMDQTLAANVDQILAVFALQPEPAWHLLDRYLVMAEAAGIPALIVLTKADLDETPDSTDAAVADYSRIGYRSLVTSAPTCRGISRLQFELAGRTSVLIGKSGAGKSTLLNAVSPGLGLRVQAVNTHTGEGRHTTTAAEMFEAPGGGWVLDTPGLRLFKPAGLEREDLAGLLPDFRPYLSACRFGGGCSHLNEPGCGVRAAVSEGSISQRRYESYLNMLSYFGWTS